MIVGLASAPLAPGTNQAGLPLLSGDPVVPDALVPSGSLIYASQAQPADDDHTDAYGRPPVSGGEIYQFADVEDVHHQGNAQVSQFPNGDLCVAGGSVFGGATARIALRVTVTDPPTYTTFVSNLLSGGIGGQLIRAEMDETGRLIMVVWSSSGGGVTTARRWNTDGTVEATYDLGSTKQPIGVAFSRDGQYVYVSVDNYSSAPPTVTVTRYDLDSAAAASTFLTQVLTASDWGGAPFTSGSLGVHPGGDVFFAYATSTFADDPVFRESYQFWLERRRAADGVLLEQWHVADLDYTDSAFSFGGTYNVFKGFGANFTFDADGSNMWGWTWNLVDVIEEAKVLQLNTGLTLHNYIAGPHSQPVRANLFVPMWPYRPSGSNPALARYSGKDQAALYGPALP